MVKGAADHNNVVVGGIYIMKTFLTHHLIFDPRGRVLTAARILEEYPRKEDREALLSQCPLLPVNTVVTNEQGSFLRHRERTYWATHSGLKVFTAATLYEDDEYVGTLEEFIDTTMIVGGDLEQFARFKSTTFMVDHEKGCTLFVRENAHQAFGIFDRGIQPVELGDVFEIDPDLNIVMVEEYTIYSIPYYFLITLHDSIMLYNRAEEIFIDFNGNGSDFENAVNRIFEQTGVDLTNIQDVV